MSTISARKKTATVQAAIEAYIRLSGINSPHTEKTYRTGLFHHFLTFLGSVDVSGESPVSALDLDYIPGFIAWLSRDYRSQAGQPLRDSSRSLYATAVTGFYRHLIARGLLPGVLMSDHDAIQEVVRRGVKYERGSIKKRLPDTEFVEAFIAAARQPPELPADAPAWRQQRATLVHQRDLAIVLSLHSTGMRVGELVALRRGSLDHAMQGAHIVGKGKHERFIRFSKEAWAAVQVYLAARQDGDLTQAMGSHPVFCRHDRRAGRGRLPLTTRSVRRLFFELATQAGIIDKFQLTPHTLRHFFATTFLRETGDLALTQDALGHADPRTTRIYASTDVAHLVDAHKRLFG